MLKVEKSFVVLWFILSICIIGIPVYFSYKISEIKTEIIIIQGKTIDSLKSEIIYKDIDLGRYEIIMDRIKEKNPALLDEVTQNLE